MPRPKADPANVRTGWTADRACSKPVIVSGRRGEIAVKKPVDVVVVMLAIGIGIGAAVGGVLGRIPESAATGAVTGAIIGLFIRARQRPS